MDETLSAPFLTDAVAFWSALFPHPAPVEIEVGCGDGAFLVAIACRQPERNFLGLERSPAKARRLAERVGRLAARNVRTLQADAGCLVRGVIPEGSVAAYHVYFPDPWWKRRHAPRRIFTPDFVAGVARTLCADGRLYFATDVGTYAVVAQASVLADGRFIETPAGDDHPGLTTSFARKYRAAGRPLYPFTFVRQADATPQRLAASKTSSM